VRLAAAPWLGFRPSLQRRKMEHVRESGEDRDEAWGVLGAPRPLLVDAGKLEVAHHAPGSSTQLLP
jgi:hypothetical protein